MSVSGEKHHGPTYPAKPDRPLLSLQVLFNTSLATKGVAVRRPILGIDKLFRRI